MKYGSGVLSVGGTSFFYKCVCVLEKRKTDSIIYFLREITGRIRERI